MSNVVYTFLGTVRIMNDLDKRNKVEAFKKELKELINKYDFGKDELDSYNGEDRFIGTDIYFTIDGERYAAETLSEILYECV